MEGRRASGREQKMSSCLDRWRWLRRGNAAEIEFKLNSKKRETRRNEKEEGKKESRGRKKML